MDSSQRSIVFLSTAALVAALLVPAAAVAESLGGAEGSTLGQEPQVTPQEIGDGSATELLYANPTEGMSLVQPPVADNTGGTALDYPLVLPKGRGMTPELSLSYDSGGGSSWAGLGWDLSVGDISVSTEFGVPLFCPRRDGPECGNVESESYTLDGEALMPSAVRTDYQPRVAEREDFTRRVETQYERIIRHGDAPDNYYWEVRDKEGNIRWYGGFPDGGGPTGDPGTCTQDVCDDPGHERTRNDGTIDRSAILADNDGNGFKWFLSAQRDVGVNQMRYEYDTVTYRNASAGSGSQWVPLNGADCPSDRICARHVYLSSIFYTGASEASTDAQPEDPAYEVRFVRQPTPRPDPVLDARGGFLDIDQERLDHVEVWYTHTDGLVTRYDLHYSPNRFGKSQLDSITQVGCAGGDPSTCDDSTAATHTFAYYDDVASAGSGFATEAAQWNTQGDNLDSGHQITRASALGMSETNGGDGHVYVGFNPTVPQKTGSFGGAVTVSGSQTDSLVEFLDINGDNLPDKVFEQDGELKYRLNESRPGDATDADVTFSGGPAGVVAGELNALPTEREFGIDGGVEAYLGVTGVLHVGGAWSFADGYFTDANADGLPDYVLGGKVLFNTLDCSSGSPGDPATCKPTFEVGSEDSRVPLDVDQVETDDDSAADALRQLRELAPQVDTVRRWVAPFTGDIAISGVATMQGPPFGDPLGNEPVWVGLQRNGDQLDSATLLGVGSQWDPARTMHVTKGTRLYFRTSSRPSGSGDDVSWDPVITYTGFATAGRDANGLRQDRFQASEDFTIAGRPGSLVAMDTAGTTHFSAAVDKGVTTDDITPQVELHRRTGGDPVAQDVTITPITATGAVDDARVKSVAEDNGEWCVSDESGGDFGCYPTQTAAEERLSYLGQDESGRFRFTADVPITDAVDGKSDMVQAWLGVDSPIDVQQITWVETPLLCYLDGNQCDADLPTVSPPVDVDIYPANNLTAPASPWTSPHTSYDDTDLDLTIAPNSTAGDVVVTIKTADGYIYKQSEHIDASGPLGSSPSIDLPDVDLSSGEKFWFDVTARDPGLGGKVTSASITLTWTDDDDGSHTEHPPVTFNWIGDQSYFPVAYRGWGFAGYRADGNRARTALHEGDFNPGPPGGGTYDDEDDACDAQPGGCIHAGDVEDMSFPDDYPVGDNGRAQVDLSSAKDQIPEAFPYLPTLTPTTTGLAESWEMPKARPTDPARLMGTATISRASRYGDLPSGFGSVSGTSLSAPSLWGATGPSFSLMGGVGPLSGSFAFGWSSSTIDYTDMNGDGFPDIVTPDKITFTNPRGGRACLVEQVQKPCEGGGAEVVQMSTTIGTGVGLEGSPIGITANSKGRTNATQGNSGNKGGAASDKEYAGDLGLSIGYDYSWTNPNSANPEYEDELGMVPGDPTSPGLATEQVLADINGDGLPDRVTADPAGVFVAFNLGYGFSSTPVKWSAGGFESGESASGSLGGGFSTPFYEFAGGISSASNMDFARYSWQDVNGDGLLDALHKTGSGVDVAFGTGIGVGDNASYGTMAELPYDVFPGVETETGGQQVRQDQSQSIGGGVDFTIYIGPICVAACYIVVNPGAHYENSLSVSDIGLVDVNGDGAPDSVSRIPQSDGDANHEQLSVRLNTAGRTGLLESVTTPMDGTMTLDYDRRGNTIEHPDTTWVLSDVKVHASLADDGISDVHRTYEYGAARYDFLQREDLGFDSLIMREKAEDGTVLRTTVHEYLNDTVFDSGLEHRTTLYDGDVTVQDGQVTGDRMQRSSTDWRVEDLMTGQPLDLSGLSANQKLRLRAAPLVNRVSQIWYDDQGGTGQQTSLRYDYDDLGNPIVITDEGDITNDGDDVVARIRYSDCTNAEGHGLRAQFGCADGAADAPHENPIPNDPDDPWDDVDTPAAVKPDAAAPYWSPDLCATWTSVPVIIEVRDAAGDLLRYRDGSPDVCDNTSVTHLKEMVKAGPTLADSTFAVTRLAYDEWGSYNRIAYPPDEQGNSYAVHYVYDQERHADVADVTDLSLHVDADPDLDQVEEFMDDPTDLLNSGDSDIVGITSRATFDGPTGRISSRTDASGNVTTYSYDAFSRTRKIDYPDGGSVSFAYAPTDDDYPYAVARHSDEFNSDTIDTATFVDGMGDLTGQKRDATFFVGRTDPTTTGWAVAGASLVDELGRTTKQWYPTQQLTGSLTDYWEATPDEDPIRTRWDALDRMTGQTASNGSVTTTSYGFGSVDGDRMSTTTVTDPLGRATVTYKDAYDNIRAVDDIAVDTGTHRTTYDVDALGQLHSVRSAPSEVIQHTYDLLGRRLTTTTPDSGETEYTYDLAGNLQTEQTAAQEADGNTLTHHTYAFGHLVSTEYTGDPSLDETFTWGGYQGVDPGDNGAGRVIGVVDSSRDQTLGYDANGHLDSETSTMLGNHPNNGPWTTEYDYDFLGRLSTVNLPDGETVVNDYDHGGQLSQVRGVKPCTDLGSLTTEIDDVQTTITVTENPTSGLPSVPFTVRIGGEQLQVTDRTATADPTQWTYTVVRGVNGTALSPTSTAHAAGASVRTDEEVTCQYRYLDRREYDEFGTREFQSLGNDVWTRYTRDPSTRRLVAQRTMSPAAPNEIQDLHYTYDLVGNLKTADNDVPADVPSLFGGLVHQEYDYDGRYRVTHAEGTWDHEPKTRRLYTYDAGYDDTSGNMTTARQRTWEIDTHCKKNCKEDVIDALSFDHSSITYADGSAHRFDVVGAQSTAQSRDYSHDASGNVTGIVTADMIREITWNAAGRMSQVVDHNPNNTGRKVTSYRYDYNGNLALEIKEQGQSSFVNPWVTVRDGTMWKHIWAGTDRLATKFSQQDSYEQKIYYLHKDLQGSTNVATDRVGKVFQHHEYVPSGQAWVDESSTIFRTPYQFGGGYVDEDHGLVNFGQRWYEPGVQAFTSVDPALTNDPVAIVTEPDLRSSYAYANNNPLSNVDSSGELFSSVHVDPAKVLELVKNLQVDGKPLSMASRNDLAAFFNKNTGLRGRMAMFWLQRQDRNEKLQAFAEALDTKPMLEFEFEDGRLSAIKLGLGIGKRKKFDFSTPATGAQAPAATGTTNPASQPAPSAPSGATQPAAGPPATSAAIGPPASGAGPPAAGPGAGGAGAGGAPASTTNVVKNTSTSAGGGSP